MYFCSRDKNEHLLKPITMKFHNILSILTCQLEDSLAVRVSVSKSNRNYSSLLKSILFALILVFWMVIPTEHTAAQVFVIDTTQFPYKGKLLSKYGMRGGRFHAGMDIKLETGDTVISAFDGTVRIARVMSGYGKMVVIRHHNGLETVYAHLSKILVNINEVVKAGQPIGLGGRTGRATTSHLHFETRYLGEHFNPDRIIDFDNYTLVRDTLLINKEFWHPLKASSTIASAHDEKSVSKKYHTIRQGDTLSIIARKYRTSVKSICKLNGIKESKTLQLGKKLRVS